MKLHKVLSNLVLELELLNKKMDRVIASNNFRKEITDKALGFTSLDIILSLPEKYRKTILALTSLSKEECSATEISNITGRQRAVESGYLKELSIRGIVKHIREGRNVFYSYNKTI